MVCPESFANPPSLEKAIPRVKEGVKCPQVYSAEELERLFDAPRINLKHRAIIMTTYAGGLRVGETCRLKPADILTDRMQIRIVEGKGRSEDLDKLDDVASKIEGRTICALGDAAAMPVRSFVKHYRHEFEYYIEHGRSLVGEKLGDAV